MRKAIPILLGMSIAAVGSMFTAAQEPSAPPKVLVMQREFIKPGKAGAIHDKSESNFVQAMARAKWPVHYVAVNSLSGKSRALYLFGYDSFDAWQKDMDASEKDTALSAEIDRLQVVDGELLDSYDSAVLTYQEDQSYRPVADLSNVRYVEFYVFRLRPGHHKDWADLMKLIIDTDKKAGVTFFNWAMYEVEYGASEEFIMISTDTGMNGIDKGDAEAPKLLSSIGPDDMKKMEDLTASCVENTDSEIFAINPKQSYPPDAWVKANPSFWKPKPTAPAAAKPVAEPAKPAATEKKP